MAQPGPPETDVIVKEPREDDVLLGQGHYRHQGNQKLNKIVDAKVDEYKNQSRVFKTYMAHDIINRMRGKGVRFLKELAPKGWIVVKDDKEAREKVAQRFQYMMRKQAADEKKGKTATSKTASKSSTTKSKKKAAPPPAAAAPPPRANLNWNGSTVQVPFLPVFHQLQKTSVLVNDEVDAISTRLRECFLIIGVQDCFNSEEANAILTTTERTKMQMNLWKPLGGNGGIIVELVNLEGDVVVFQKYSRYVLEATTGLFDKYKHTLFQSGATASVQDQISALSYGKKVHAAGGVMDPECQVRRSKVMPKGSNSLAPKLAALTPTPLPEVHSSSMGHSSGTGRNSSSTGRSSFASAFGRWETGIDEDEADPDMDMYHLTSGEANARRPSAAARTIFDVEPGEANARRPSAARTISALETGEVNARRPSAETRTIFAVDMGSGMTRQHETNSGNHASNFPPSGLENNRQGAKRSSLAGARPSQVSSGLSRSEQSVSTSRSLLSEEDRRRKKKGSLDRFFGEEVRSGRPTHAFDRWSAASTGLSSNQEMKCDSITMGTIDAEMASIDHTIESIARLSISSNDASFVDNHSRVSRDISEAFGGQWPLQAFSNQAETKHEGSSDDDEVYGMGDQSFIPSSFFGAAPSQNAVPRARTTPSRAPPSPSQSFNSNISVDMMRSVPSPTHSFNSQVSMGLFSIPSSCGTLNSRRSERNSLKHTRGDGALSPSMFQDQSTGNDPGSTRFDALRINDNGMDDSIQTLDVDPENFVPPTIFVESSSDILGPTA